MTSGENINDSSVPNTNIELREAIDKTDIGDHESRGDITVSFGKPSNIPPIKMAAVVSAPVVHQEENDEEEVDIGPSFMEQLLSNSRRLFNYLVKKMNDPDDSRMAIAWVAFMLLILWYNYLTVTFRISYFRKMHTRSSIIGFAVVDIFVDMCCMFDIFINFFKRYPGSDGIYVYEKRKTVKHYLIGNKWFIFDLIATIPVDWVFIGWKPVVASMVRLFKLIRMLKMNTYWKELQNSIAIVSGTTIQLTKFISYVLVLTHFCACGWYLVAEAQDTGVTAVFTMRPNLFEIGVMSRYLTGFYWCITSMTGYGGNVIPVTFLQVLYYEFVLLVGTAMYVIIIGTAGSLVINNSSSETKIKEKMEQMTEYMSFRKIPAELQNKIKDYYTFLWKSRKGWDEKVVLQDLPNYLRMEINLDINKILIEKVPLFKDRSRMFISSIVMSLVPRVTLPGSAIVRKGEIGREMYFISSGSVDIVSEDNPPRVFASLGAGQFFGEIAIVFEQRRGATVLATSFCDLYVLTKDSLEAIAVDYPDEVEAIRKIAKERMEETMKQQQAKVATPPAPPKEEEEKNEDSKITKDKTSPTSPTEDSK